MDNLVTVKSGQPVTTSLQIAETFGRTHKDVMNSIRDIQNEIEKPVEASDSKKREKFLFLNHMFYEDTYKVKNNIRSYPMFYMNKDGFALLVMGFTGRKATKFKLQYISQFNQMESEIKQRAQLSLPQNYAEALKELANQVEENEQLKGQLQQPDFEKSIMAQSKPVKILYTTEEVAERCGFSSAVSLNKELNKQKIIYHQKGLWHLYYQYKDKGYKDTSTKRKSQSWTDRGLKFIKSRTSKEVE